MRVRVLPLVVLLAPLVVSCHRSKSFTSKVRVDRIEVVHREPDGKPISTDVDIVWTECPGVQRQTIRVGREFSQCAKGWKAGVTHDVDVLWEWDEHGHWDWHVTKMGGCAIPHVDDDDSSFESIAECTDSKQHDAVVGFHCDLVSQGELVRKCPWFKGK